MSCHILRTWMIDKMLDAQLLLKTKTSDMFAHLKCARIYYCQRTRRYSAFCNLDKTS